MLQIPLAYSTADVGVVLSVQEGKRGADGLERDRGALSVRISLQLMTGKKTVAATVFLLFTLQSRKTAQSVTCSP